MDDFKPHIVVINLGTNLVSKRFGISRGTPDTVSINFISRWTIFLICFIEKNHMKDEKKSNIARSFQWETLA